jgi:signal transduction histidine kinase
VTSSREAGRVLRRLGTTPGDLALALAVTALVASEVTSDMVADPWLASLVTLPVMVSLAWRRRFPVAVVVAVCSVNLWLSVTAPGPFPPQLLFVAVLVAIYSAAAYTLGWRAAVAAVVSLVLVVVAHVLTRDGDAGDFLPLLVWGAPWLAGRLVRRRTLEAGHAATEAALLVERRAAEAREAAARERDRIARELHDVVAHAVSLMVVQAGAERLTLGEDQPRTRSVLEAIESAGRQALVELRAMLVVLRSEDVDDAGTATGGSANELTGPQPDLAQLPDLVARVRHAGLPVELSLDVDGSEPAGVALSAYRIVQEALTNVLKHGPSPTEVRVRRQGPDLVVEVRSTLEAGSVSPPADGGRGLVGMRERARLHSGTVSAGPIGGSWVVRARLPLARVGVG